MTFAWTDERFEEMTRMVADGLSASEIASRFGDGCTRNAIIGKCQRKGLRLGSGNEAERKLRQIQRRQEQNSRRQRQDAALIHKIKHRALARRTPLGVSATNKRAAVAKPPPADLAAPVHLMLPLEQLTDAMCHWPVGDPGTEGFGFCGHGAHVRMVKGHLKVGPYCEYHSRLAYQPPAEREAA